MPILDLEEDYEANYPDGWRPDPYEKLLIPVGKCHRMCPSSEIQERENNRRLNKYEIKPNSDPPRVDFDLVMKEFKRSCVGRQFTDIVDLRPWSVLQRSLYHLLMDICLRNDDWMYICDFVFDRLKAIRQDIIIQRIEGKRYIEVLEGSVRFLIYSMYRLTCTLKDYSSNHQMQTIVPLEGPVNGLDNYELNVIREMKLTMSCLRDCLSSLLVQYQENVPDSPFRPLFESVNLIINLPFLHGHVKNVTDFLSKQSLRNSDSIFKIVFKMYREHLAGNHLSALKELPRLAKNPLLVLAYAPVLACLQIHMINMLKKAYSATGANTSSVQHLSSIITPAWLNPGSDEERFQFCRFIAFQFGIYDQTKDICDYKLDKTTKLQRLPRDFVEKAKFERQKTLVKGSFSDNETRAYALQFVAGRDWPMFQSTLELYGLSYVLDTRSKTR